MSWIFSPDPRFRFREQKEVAGSQIRRARWVWQQFIVQFMQFGCVNSGWMCWSVMWWNCTFFLVKWYCVSFNFEVNQSNNPIVLPFCKNPMKTIPLESQKIVAMNLPADGTVFAFLGADSSRKVHCSYCRLVSGV